MIVLNEQILLAGNPRWEQTAQNLNQQGVVQLYQGQPSVALKSWQSAYHAYKQSNNKQGMTGSLINQSLAFKALGSYDSACQVLIQALELEPLICPSPPPNKSKSYSLDRLNQLLQTQPAQSIQIVGLYNLGNVLRLLGEIDASSAVLQKALSIKAVSPNSYIFHQLLLSIASTEFSFYKRAKNQFLLIDEPVAKQKAFNLTQSKIKSALATYKKLTKVQDETALQASIYQLNLLIEVKTWNNSSFSSLYSNEDIFALIKNILHQFDTYKNISTIDYIFLRLNLVHNLTNLFQLDAFKTAQISPNYDLLTIILSKSQEALIQSYKLNNHRAISSTLGILGNVYKTINQLTQAQKHYEQAVASAQSIQAWDIAYEWQWRLGQLYQQLGRLDKSKKAYAAAISSLDQARRSILGYNPDFQFAFQEKIEPIYHEYTDILLSLQQPDLEKVIRNQEKLKLVELENFLQCGQLPLVSLLDSKIPNLPPVIYLIKTKNHLAIIVRDSQGNLHEHRVPFTLIDSSITNLINYSQKTQFVKTQNPDFLSYCQTLYQLMFVPIKTYLPDSGTLIFILDRYLQNLPLNMLHDGQNYIIASYSISTDLSSYFSLTKPLPFQESKILVAGIYEESPSLNDPNVPKNFKPLPEIKAEIEKIKLTANSATELLNDKFTMSTFQNKFTNNSLEIIHLSTHAQFSSDPNQNFILAWDRPLNINDIESILKKRYSGIDLLVLSACQTAKGDKRSALGIAGIATQAGARSTVASLWLVDAESTSILMGAFYEGLKNGLTKAEALRSAQLTLMSTKKYAHPFFWAAFVLIGNWI
ncbi:MAG TPA: CHAT domain-containing protein [Leptolyngbyaceae cyanobacterium]